MLDVILLQVGIAAGLVLGLLGSVEFGYRVGKRRMRGTDAGKAMETGAIQGAMLGLLGLLLGFSFAGASGRYMERQDLITAEANAIGTAYLRADLIDAPHADELRAALGEHVAHRVEASGSLQRGATPEMMAQVRGFHDRIWAAASAGVAARPGVAVAVLNPVNDVLDLHATRVAATRKHLPALVLGLLIVCSLLTLGVIGYACALAKRRNTTMTSVIAVLIGAAIWTTLDLDRPRIGLVQLADTALQELRLEPGPPTP